MKCDICSNRINKKKEFYIVSGRLRYCKHCSIYVFRFITNVGQLLRKENLL